MKKILACISIAGILMMLFASGAGATGVKPLVIDLEMSPGQSEEFELVLTPGSEEEEVEFSFYKPEQLIDGGLTYSHQEETEDFSAVDWVNLETDSTMVYPGEEEKISGEVEVPFGASGGTNTVVIMVEPQQKSQQQGGIEFMVRYAVRVNIRVDQPGVRPEAEVDEFDLGADKEERPQIKTLLSNPSQLDYLVEAEATLRDADRRLVERVTLATREGTKPDTGQTRMYPGSQVRYFGDIESRLAPGEYTLRVFFRYGEYGQLIRDKEIEIREGEYKFPSIEETGGFDLEPREVELELAPGAQKTEVLNLESEIAESVRVVAEVEAIRDGYEYCLLDWIRLRGEKDFKLDPNRRKRVVKTANPPRELEPGSYHGKIVLKAFSTEGTEKLATTEVPVSAKIGEDHNREVELGSLYNKKVEEGHILSVVLANRGSVFITPEVEVVIRDEEGSFVDRATLSSAGGEDKLLPLLENQLRGTADQLEPGKYKAELTVIDGVDEIKEEVQEFTVTK